MVGRDMGCDGPFLARIGGSLAMKRSRRKGERRNVPTAMPGRKPQHSTLTCPLLVIILLGRGTLACIRVAMIDLFKSAKPRSGLRQDAMLRTLPIRRWTSRWLACGCALGSFVPFCAQAEEIALVSEAAAGNIVIEDAIPVSDAELSAIDVAMLADIPIPPTTTFPPGRAVPASEWLPAEGSPLIGPQEVEEKHEGAEAEMLSDGRPGRTYASFGEDVKAIKWEIAAVAGYYTAINGPKLFMDPRWPRFSNEGWFGRNTNNVGIDKLAHSYSAYVISEILYARLKHKTGDAPGIQWTAAAIASGVMAYTEAWDSIEPSGGWSWQDITFNTAGAGFSVLRNSVPGLDRKLDFRLMWEANGDILTFRGKRHFQRQRYFFALKPSGFSAFEKSPLRFVELHLGYRGDDFLNEDRAAGIRPKRHVFVGVGLNLREILFKNPRSRAGRAAGEVLDYFQPPLTALHHDITE